MRLLRLSAHFGVLDGAELRLEPGALQLVIDGNERGKSTFVAAIVAALYGLLPGTRGAPWEQSRYRPLTGERFEVELDIQAGRRRLRIRRDLARGSCSVVDLDTVQDLTAAFQSGKSQWEIGQALLGLNREQFLRTALVRQGEISGLNLEKESATLTSRIQQLVDSNAGDHTADAAIQALDAALKGYEGIAVKHGNAGNEIKALEQRIVAAERRLEQLRHGRASLDADAERMARLLAEAAELRQRRNQAALLAQRADACAGAERLHDDDLRHAHLDALVAQRQMLADLPEIDPRLPDELARLDGAIGACDRRLAGERDALARAEAESRDRALSLTGRKQLREATAASAQEVLRAYERLRQAQDAEEAARDALRRAEGAAEADIDLARRFERLSGENEDSLSRYGERRSELLALLVTPPGSSTASPRPVLLGGVGMVLAGLIVLLLLPVAGLLLALAGGGLVLWSLLRLVAAPAVVVHGGGRTEIERSLAELEHGVAAIVRRLDYGDLPVALDSLRCWQESRGRREQVRAVRCLFDEAAAVLLSARQTGDRVVARWGKQVACADLDPGLLLALHEELSRYLQDRQTLALAKTAAAELWQRVESSIQERAVTTARFAEAAGSPAESAEERAAALARIAEQIATVQRRRTLDSQIVEVEAGLLSADVRAAVEHAAAAMPQGAAVCAGPATPVDYRAEMVSLANEADERAAEARQLEAKLAVALNDFEGAYPEVELNLEQDRTALARARGFESAAGLARDLLVEVARETHHHWSRRLNAATGAILDRFATEHTELRFGDRLEFVVRDRISGREWSRRDVERRLSAGARDQIYLAIRLALAGYFSTGAGGENADPLPLILDDPLVSSDDRRFAAVMTYLAEEARHRQVIVLTCHAERHRWWLQSTGEAAHVRVLGVAKQ